MANSAEKKLKTKSFAKYSCKDDKTIIEIPKRQNCRIFAKPDLNIDSGAYSLKRAKLVYIVKFLDNKEYGEIAEVRFCSTSVQESVAFNRDICFKESKKRKSSKFNINTGYVPKAFLKPTNKKY